MNNATKEIMGTTVGRLASDIGDSLGYGFRDIGEIDEINEINENNEDNEISLGTLDKDTRNPDSATLLSTLQDIARQKSTNRVGDDNRTLSKLSGIQESKILKTLKALQKNGAISLAYQKATVGGGWLTGRTIVIKSP